MRRFIPGLIILILVTIWLAFIEGKPIKQGDKPFVKIGVILPLTGNYAELAENAKAAIELALNDYIPKNINVEILYEDDGYNAAKVATAANKLINVDKVNAIVSWSAMAGNIVAPIAERNRIIHFGISNDVNIVKGLFNFTHFTSSEAQVEKLMQLVKKNNVKSMNLLVGNQNGIHQTADLLEKELKKKKIKVYRFNYNNEIRNFNMLVSAAKKKNAGMWYVVGVLPSLDILIKTIKDKGVDAKLTSITSFSFSNEKSLLKDVVFVDTYDGDPELLSRIYEKTRSNNYFSLGFVYDSIGILVKTYDQLYEKEKVIIPDNVANKILDIKDYNGSVGKLIVDSEGIFQSEAVFKTINNEGQIEVIGE